MNTALQLIASLSILVFIHELGHFAFARLFGARVEKFYLFFHPWFSIFKYKSKRSGTIYGLGWLPLGGYCKIAGMIDESLDEEGLASEPKPDEFRSKPAFARLLIMAGGVIFNLILAWFIYSAIAFTWGDKHLDASAMRDGYSFGKVAQEIGFKDGDILLSTDRTDHLNVLSPRFSQEIIGAHEVSVLRNGQDTVHLALPKDLMERLLASGEGLLTVRTPLVIDSVLKEQTVNAGLRSGLKIVSVNGVAINNLTELQTLLAEQKGRDVQILASVHGSTDTLSYSVPVDSTGLLGISFLPLEEVYKGQITHIEYNILTAIPAGFTRATTTVSNYVSSLKLLFTKEGAKQVGGLGTMGKLFPKTFDWSAFWSITAFLSIILAVMNLLPIPALDGGHILFILIEMLRGGRKLSDQTMMRIQTVGIVILMALMLYANGNDLYRYLIK